MNPAVPHGKVTAKAAKYQPAYSCLFPTIASAAGIPMYTHSKIKRANRMA
jgi:hypothetical protein